MILLLERGIAPHAEADAADRRRLIALDTDDQCLGVREDRTLVRALAGSPSRGSDWVNVSTTAADAQAGSSSRPSML